MKWFIKTEPCGTPGRLLVVWAQSRCEWEEGFCRMGYKIVMTLSRLSHILSTHWGLNQMTNSSTVCRFSKTFSWMNIGYYILIFHRKLFTWIQLGRSQCWFTYWLLTNRQQAIIWSNDDSVPDSKVDETSMGLTWVLSAPDGPHVGPMNLVSGVYWCHMGYSSKCCQSVWDIISHFEQSHGIWENILEIIDIQTKMTFYLTICLQIHAEICLAQVHLSAPHSTIIKCHLANTGISTAEIQQSDILPIITKIFPMLYWNTCSSMIFIWSLTTLWFLPFDQKWKLLLNKWQP